MKAKVLKRLGYILLLVMVLLVVVALVCYLVLDGWKRLFFTFGFGVLALNIFMAYYFVKANAKRLVGSNK